MKRDRGRERCVHGRVCALSLRTPGLSKDIWCHM